MLFILHKRAPFGGAGVTDSTNSSREQEGLIFPTRLPTPVSIIWVNENSLLHPLREQGDLSHTYFCDMDV